MNNIYRGQRKDNNKWVFGDVVHVGNHTYISYYSKYKRPDFELEQFINDEVTSNDITLIGVFPFIEVIPETVGLFIEKKDVDDVEIFQGDILKVKHSILNINAAVSPEKTVFNWTIRGSYNVQSIKKENGNYDYIYYRNYVVTYDAEKSVWVGENPNYGKHGLYMLLDLEHNGRIIGNIHDNPSLLLAED